MSLRRRICIALTVLSISTGVHALDLEEALERAEQYDATLRQAMSDYMVAEELYPQSRANLLPDIQAGGFYQRNDTSRERSTGNIPDVDSAFTTKGYDVTLNQVISVADITAGNLCITVKPTAGCENSPVVIVQGHMDMVCEKNSDVDFDFMKDPIDVRVDGDWVKANGTTLGADNGIGVATGLAWTPVGGCWRCPGRWPVRFFPRHATPLL